MNYYVVLPDKRIGNPFSFSMTKGQLSSTEPLVINVGNITNEVIIDLSVLKILFRSYFFLSDVMAKVFRLYDETLEYVPVFFTNKDYSMQLVYWRTDMPETKYVVTNKFDKAENMIINENHVKNKPIHKIQYEKQTYLLINQYVAESILRRQPVGVWLQKVKKLEGDVEYGCNYT